LHLKTNAQEATVKKLIIFIFYFSFIFTVLNPLDIKKYNLIYNFNGDIVLKSIYDNAKIQITKSNNTIKYFIISSDYKFIIYSTLSNSGKNNYISEMHKLNTDNMQIEIISKKTFAIDPNDPYPKDGYLIWFEKEFNLLKPLAFNPKNNNEYIYNDGKVKFNIKIDDSQIQENRIGDWGDCIPEHADWHDKYIIVYSLGHEALSQFIYRIDVNRITYLKNNDLNFGGFYSYRFTNGFLNNNILVINESFIISSNKTENNLKLYDIDNMRMYHKYQLKNEVIVKPFNNELYSINCGLLNPNDDIKLINYDLKNNNEIIISKLDKIPKNNKRLDSNFIYDARNKILYGTAVSMEKEQQLIIYAYDIKNDNYYFIDYIDWYNQFYVIN